MGSYISRSRDKSPNSRFLKGAGSQADTSSSDADLGPPSNNTGISNNSTNLESVSRLPKMKKTKSNNNKGSVKKGNNSKSSDQGNVETTETTETKKDIDDKTQWRFGEKVGITKNDGMGEALWLLMNGNPNAPVQSLLESGTAKVLDFACRGGFWVMNMSRLYPTTTFVGLDVDPPSDPSHLLPSFNSAVIPVNVTFQSSPLNAKLPFDDETFDYVIFNEVGVRTLGGSAAWKGVIDEVTRVLKDGGYIELVDTNWTPYHAGPNFLKFCGEVAKFSVEIGIDMSHAESLAQILESNVHITEVKHDYVPGPIGWNGLVGEKLSEVVSIFIMSMEHPIRERLGMDKDEYENFRHICLKECAEAEAFVSVHYAYGRKKLS